MAFGGIAGLFLGFSLLSGVEILYYFTLRACCMVNSNPEELEKLNEEYEHYDQPEIDLGLKPLWAEDEPPKKKQNLNKKTDPFVLPFLP